ncbi:MULTISPECIES: PA2779 family protein [Marinobacter]|uniref:PA2779 family protein n=1 Tax=Marinobacter xiaoshiensis TaxID=3073652 RepID=A0ABU2HFY7_9GAMM|nr:MULTISPECIES: PA2779 family protein [unclassified Marinobacter]MBK1885668.1 PA2779 family protein [Marinobacter sp. DY40_1A1]MDS1309658.1 PA2779 family protein [Marinobacter sp. F60267]
MQAIRSYTQSVSAIMALVMILSSMWAIPASANIVGTGELLTEQRADIDREALMSMLEREDVKGALASMGVGEQEVRERIQSLTPSELADFKQQLAEAPTGEGVVGIIVLFLLVFIITDMLCATDIFPFINCIR